MKTHKTLKIGLLFFFGGLLLISCEGKKSSQAQSNVQALNEKKILEQNVITKRQQTTFDVDTVYDILWHFTEHDFGKVKQGTKPSVKFTFTVLDGMAQITGSRTYCGCTVPEWQPIEFMKGDSYSIEVKFNTENKMGMFNESVDLFFNRSQIPEKLTVKGVIVE